MDPKKNFGKPCIYHVSNMKKPFPISVEDFLWFCGPRNAPNDTDEDEFLRYRRVFDTLIPGNSTEPFDRRDFVIANWKGPWPSFFPDNSVGRLLTKDEKNCQQRHWLAKQTDKMEGIDLEEWWFVELGMRTVPPWGDEPYKDESEGIFSEIAIAFDDIKKWFLKKFSWSHNTETEEEVLDD